MTSGYALFPKHPASEMTFYILFHNFIHIQFMKSSRRRNISRPLHDRTSVFPRKYRKYLIKLQTLCHVECCDSQAFLEVCAVSVKKGQTLLGIKAFCFQLLLQNIVSFPCFICSSCDHCCCFI